MLTLLVATALVFGTAFLLAARLAEDGVTQLLLGTYTIAFAEIILVSFALSIGGHLERSTMLIALAATFVAILACSRHVRAPPVLARARPLARLLRDPLLSVAFVLVAATLVYSACLALFTPENERDALGYHLTRGALWRQGRGIGVIGSATDATLNDYPPHAEIAQMFTMLTSSSARYAGLVQFAAALATGVAVYGIARRVGVETRAALFGALLFLTAPVVALQASTGLTDLVVAAGVASSAFFLLGTGWRNLVLATLAIGLLVGTKLSALLAVPMLIVLAALARPTRAQRVAAVATGTALGMYWYAANVVREGNPLGSIAGERVGFDLFAALARILRLTLAAIELPGAVGLDRLLYVVAAVVVVALLASRNYPQSVTGALVAGAAMLTPLVLVELGHVLTRGYLKLFYEVGRPDLYVDPNRSFTKASPIFSWYGPLGVFLTLLAAGLVGRLAQRRELRREAVVLAAAPVYWIVAIGLFIPYFEWNGRFAMGGFALAAATWGLVYRLRPIAWAAAIVAVITAGLSFIHLHDKPSGLRLLEPVDVPSVWTQPDWVVQGSRPHMRALLRYVRGHVPDHARLALYPEHYPGPGDPRGDLEPFPFFGPNLSRTILFASTADEALAKGADWAVLHSTPDCLTRWRSGFRFDGWVVLRRSSWQTCSGPAALRTELANLEHRALVSLLETKRRWYFGALK
jgi:hypothetical protein